jgi:signal transduction histidine kinase
VEADGRPLARVVGAAARLEESGVREAIRRAASLAAENARLTARLREAVHDVERSRARLIQAGDAEQRILARELAYDIGEPLKAVRTALLRLGEPSTPATDSRAVDLVDRALDELSDISHGLHPSALDGGLAEALEVLTRRMPIPIVLQVDDDIEDAVAQVVYYVCAEAVTNAVRHAACGSITVGVTLEGGLVAVLVEDDGRGGATVRPGSGLAGLAARVADGDGTLELASPPGGGTRVLVTLPVERDALRVEVSR